MWKRLWLVIAMLAFAIPAFAGVKILVDGENKGIYDNLNFVTGTTVTQDGTKANITLTSTGTTATIGAGTINGATIGASTASTIVGTTIGGTTITGSGVLSTSLTTDASSLTVGSIVTAGGVACAKQLYLGDDLDMSVSGTGVYDLTLKDSVADALSIVRGTTDMVVFNSSTPLITITPATTITGTVTASGALGVGGITTATGLLKADGGIGLTAAGDLAIGAATVTSVTITPPTTVTGALTTSAALILSSENVTTSAANPGVGVAAVTKTITNVTTDETGASADTISLADGTTGQIKIINLKVDAETAGLKIAPTHFAGSATATTDILLEDVGDSVTLTFNGTNWVLVSNIGGTLE